MPAGAHKRRPCDTLKVAAPSRAGHAAAERLFAALRPLHGLGLKDCGLLNRAASGLRYIQAMQPFRENERSLMRIALADLPTTEALIVEAAATCAADMMLTDDLGALTWLSALDRHRVAWFAALLRLAKSIEGIRGSRDEAIHTAWTHDVVYLELDGIDLSSRDIDLVLAGAGALEASTGRRLVVVSPTSLHRGLAAS